MLMKPEAFERELESAKKSADASNFRSEGKYSVGYVKIDWKKNYGPAVDQGQCGSCWAFATVAAIEGNLNVNFGDASYIFSKQQLVDCDKTNGGCNGGWPNTAFDHFKTNGIMTEADYPYKAVGQTCALVAEKAKKIVSGYVLTQATCDAAGVEKWIATLSKGPVEVVIDAGTAAFQMYKSGVLDTTCTSINHAVTAVGIDSDATGDFIIIRNSWSSRWGETGYLRVRLNTNSGCSCYVTKYAWLPTISGKPDPNPNPNPNPDPNPNPNPNPNPTPVPVANPIFYKDCDYSGNSLSMNSSIDNLTRVSFEDTISGFKLGPAKKATLFDQAMCKGNGVSFTSDVACLSKATDKAQRRANRLSSSVLIETTQPAAGCVKVFADCCFQGTGVEICATSQDLTLNGMDNRISSIQFGTGVSRVIIHNDSQTVGVSYSVSASAACLDQGDSKAFNDSASSLTLIK
jgi:hypothetical protein